MNYEKIEKYMLTFFYKLGVSAIGLVFLGIIVVLVCGFLLNILVLMSKNKYDKPELPKNIIDPKFETKKGKIIFSIIMFLIYSYLIISWIYLFKNY